jgi:hypothetical protein
MTLFMTMALIVSAQPDIVGKDEVYRVANWLTLNCK